MTSMLREPSNCSTEVAGASRSELMDGIKQGLIIGTLIALIAIPAIHFYRLSTRVPAPPSLLNHLATSPDPIVRSTPHFADFSSEQASGDAKFIANWVADSGDNRKLPFVIIDKRNTKVFVFDPDGKLMGATPVLLGAAPGDEAVTGIGKRPISEVLPEERTTAAGRFVGERGRNANNEDVVWVDYEAAVSMHRVRIVDPKERRLERLASPTTDDNRISYGCVNMPVAFFENVLSPVFQTSYGVVYVLPEFKTLQQVFPAAYDPAAKYASTPPVSQSVKLQSPPATL